MAKRVSEAVRKFVPGMRKMSELAIGHFEFEVVAPIDGMRSKSNIEAVLGKEGLLTLVRLAISHNLPQNYGFMIAGGLPNDGGKWHFSVMPSRSVRCQMI